MNSWCILGNEVPLGSLDYCNAFEMIASVLPSSGEVDLLLKDVVIS